MAQIGMSEALQAATSDRNVLSGVHSEADRYDGSRTSAEKQLLIWQLEREGRSVNEIAGFLKMNPYTVQAVIARKDDLITDARMLLKANALEFAHNAIEASQEAAKRGKLEGISAMLDRLDVTQPPRGSQGSNVAVQINLHGGPEPVSLAKVESGSETLEIQAQTGVGLISQPMSTAGNPPQPAQAQSVTANPTTESDTSGVRDTQGATNVAEDTKQA